MMPDFSVTSDNIHIVDSAMVSKRDFDAVLAIIRAEYPFCPVWERGFGSLKNEWAVHNALYALGIARARTRDVDLNVPQPWYLHAAYAVLGVMARIVIK